MLPSPSLLLNLLHDEAVVESAQEEVSLFGGFAPVAEFEFLVVTHAADDVDWCEVLAHDGEELEADRHEFAAACADFAAFTALAFAP